MGGGACPLFAARRAATSSAWSTVSTWPSSHQTHRGSSPAAARYGYPHPSHGTRLMDGRGGTPGLCGVPRGCPVMGLSYRTEGGAPGDAGGARVRDEGGQAMRAAAQPSPRW